jgi:hypothetical protein
VPVVLALCGIGKRSYYAGLAVGFFVLGLLMGLIGCTVKSEVLFGVWILIVAVSLGFSLAAQFYSRRSAG